MLIFTIINKNLLNINCKQKQLILFFYKIFNKMLKRALTKNVVINKMLIRGETMKKIKNLKLYERCLIIIDMVNGFVKEGVLHDDEISKVIPRQLEIIKDSLANGSLLVFVKDKHSGSSVEFKRFGNTKHCLQGTSESEVIDELRSFENCDNVVSVEKNSTSFMESPTFRKLISNLTELKEVDIIGCCTDICVANGSIGLANYFDQNNRDVDIYVHEDAIETYDAPMHERQKYTEAAKLLIKQQGIKLVKGKK